MSWRPTKSILVAAAAAAAMASSGQQTRPSLQPPSSQSFLCLLSCPDHLRGVLTLSDLGLWLFSQVHTHCGRTAGLGDQCRHQCCDQQHI